MKVARINLKNMTKTLRIRVFRVDLSLNIFNVHSFPNPTNV